VVVQGKRGDESTDGVVYVMKSRGSRTEPFGEHHKMRYTRTESVITSDTKGGEMITRT